MIGSPERATPEQIRRREFGTVRLGYDTGQVRAHLEQLARLVEDPKAAVSLPRPARTVPNHAPSSDPGWSWGVFILVSLGIAGIVLLVAAEAGGFFVEPLSVGDKIASTAMLVIGAGLLIGGIRARSMVSALLGMFFLSMAALGWLGVPNCHQDCGME